MHVLCTPLALIHVRQAERVHRPWKKYTGSSVKPPGTDQRAVSRYAALAQASSDACESGLSLNVASARKAAARLCRPWTSAVCPNPTFVNCESGRLTTYVSGHRRAKRGGSRTAALFGAPVNVEVSRRFAAHRAFQVRTTDPSHESSTVASYGVPLTPLPSVAREAVCACVGTESHGGVPSHAAVLLDT